MTRTAAAQVVSFVLAVCGRCSGKGYLEGFTHVRGGQCFRCSGAGKVRISAAQAAREEQERAEKAAHYARVNRALAAQFAADRAAIDMTGATPCRYSDANCAAGRCSSCVDGMVPDPARNRR